MRSWGDWTTRRLLLRVDVLVRRVVSKRDTVGGDGRSQVALEADSSTVALLGGAVDIGSFGVDLGYGRGMVGSCTAVHGSLLSHEVGKLLRSSRQARGGVLASQRRRGLVKVLGQSQQGEVLGVVPFTVIDLGAAEDGASQGKRGSGHHRRLGGNKVSVVESNLAKVGSHMFDFCIVTLLGSHELGEEVDGGVANGPLEGVEDVHLHLGEHAGIVETATHVVELVDLGNTVLLVAVLGGDEEGGTADELIVLLVHDSSRAVSVQQVDGEKERLWEQSKGGVGLDEEVDKVGSHKPLNLALHVDEASIRQGLVLHVLHVVHDVLEVLLASKAGELSGNDVLCSAGEHLGSSASVEGRLLERLVGLDEEGVIVVVEVRHDCC